MMKAVIDRALAFVISKKLSVFLISTFFMYKGLIPSTDWIHLAMVYIGSQAALDMLINLRKNK